MKIITSTLLFLSLFFTNTCFSASAPSDSTATNTDSVQIEKPIDGLKIITELYRTKDSKTLISKRYSELPDAPSPAMMQKMESILSNRFAKKTFVDQMVNILETAQKSTPNLVVNPRPKPSETDQMVEFEIKPGQNLKLYLMKTGLWGFHM